MCFEEPNGVMPVDEAIGAEEDRDLDVALMIGWISRTLGSETIVPSSITCRERQWIAEESRTDAATDHETSPFSPLFLLI
jgi:hypothetical protein